LNRILAKKVIGLFLSITKAAHPPQAKLIPKDIKKPGNDPNTIELNPDRNMKGTAPITLIQIFTRNQTKTVQLVKLMSQFAA